MDQHYIAIAEIDFLTNVPRGYWPTDAEAEHVAGQVLTEFESRIGQSSLASDIEILSVEYRIGCIITTITVGVAIGAGAAGGMAAFWVKYPKIRQGLILCLRDLHTFGTHLFDKEKKVSTWLYSDEVFDSGKIETTAKAVQKKRAKPIVPDKKPKPGVGRRTRHQDGPSL